MDTTDQIRRLNDLARQSLSGCRLMITSGINALDDVNAIIAAVQIYSDFNADNDPYHEHDFGSFMHANQKIFWKFDYYDKCLTNASENPADPSITERVLTIMLAEEY